MNARDATAGGHVHAVGGPLISQRRGAPNGHIKEGGSAGVNKRVSGNIGDDDGRAALDRQNGGQASAWALSFRRDGKGLGLVDAGGTRLERKAVGGAAVG